MMMMIGKCQEFNLQPARAGPINLCLAFVMRNVCLAEPRENAEATLKSCELFIYGNTHYYTNLFCKNVLK